MRRKLDTVEAIAEESILLNSTVEWWKKEMEAVVQQVEQLDEEDPFGLEVNEEREQLEEKIRYLTQKGEYENQNILTLNSKIDEFIKNKKENILSQLVSASINKKKRQNDS